MTIEVGDTVQTSNKPSRLFGALLVIEIVGDNATCAYNLLDKDLQGDERPTSYSPTTGIFPINELTKVRKKVD